MLSARAAARALTVATPARARALARSRRARSRRALFVRVASQFVHLIAVFSIKGEPVELAEIVAHLLMRLPAWEAAPAAARAAAAGGFVEGGGEASLRLAHKATFSARGASARGQLAATGGDDDDDDGDDDDGGGAPPNDGEADDDEDEEIDARDACVRALAAARGGGIGRAGFRKAFESLNGIKLIPAHARQLFEVAAALSTTVELASNAGGSTRARSGSSFSSAKTPSAPAAPGAAAAARSVCVEQFVGLLLLDPQVASIYKTQAYA